MKDWWRSAAWPWLKKNWWLVVLFPIGVLAVINKVFRPHTSVVTSELLEAESTRHEVEEAAREARELALEQKTARIIEVQEEHAAVVAELTEDQASKAGALLDDPEALNSYLLQVGKDVRDDPS